MEAATLHEHSVDKQNFSGTGALIDAQIDTVMNHSQNAYLYHSLLFDNNL